HDAATRGVPHARTALAEARAGLAAARDRAAHHREYVEALTARHDASAPAEPGLRSGLRRLLRTAAERQAAEAQRDRTQAEILDLLVHQRSALEDAQDHLTHCVRAERLAAEDLHTRSTVTLDETASAASRARAR
ncbi:hypothetical protein, partial [Kitasatospora putterlickiae]|uniref:hypothetical protein n=1 Tax=Kitasatospora putterlickiae TaxID=221725 RepID=UPI0031D0575E